MLLDDYQKRVEELLHKARDTQRENVIKAGTMIADSIGQGGNIYLSGICHAIEMDLINRGGGPTFYRKFAWKLDITENNARQRDRSDLDTNMEGLAAYALKASSMRPGDVLFVGSVSGRTKAVVDLAVEAKKMGIKVIAFTSLEYAAASGIASDYLLWSITSVAVDELMKRGKTPGILKSANFPGGNDYNLNELQPHYQKYGW